MITRADIEAELAKWDTHEKQLAKLKIFIKTKLPAHPVVNGPLKAFMDSENISLEDIIIENLPSYQNWIGHVQPTE